MTYFHMGKPHTIIGARMFHFWVRDGIRWFHTAIVARKNGFSNPKTTVVRIEGLTQAYIIFLLPKIIQVIWSRQSTN